MTAPIDPASPTSPVVERPRIALTDVWFMTGFRSENPEGRAFTFVDLNPEDVALVQLGIDPGGDAVIGIHDSEFRVTEQVWLELRPADARALADQLLAMAEVAQPYADQIADRGQEQP